MSEEKYILSLFDKSGKKENVGDVSSVSYNKYSTCRLKRFKISGDIFFDNIIIWCTYNVNNIRKCHNHIRTTLISIGLRTFAISTLNIGKSKNNDIIDKDNDYISFKISLSNENPEILIQNLKSHSHVLRNSQIFLKDIDITADCFGSSTREYIRKHILKNNIASEEDIVKDKNKVGNNCISWHSISGNGTRLRIKVYNKFVQMLESSEIRSYIGSRLSSIVSDSSKRFRNVLKECKDCGLTRVEIKVYSQHIHDFKSYTDTMYDLLDLLEGCTIHSTSFENQWKALVDEIYDKKVLMIYDKGSKIFSYCHWYNSLTKRRQGIIKKNTNMDNVKNLIANYSFNERVTKYIEIDNNGKHKEQLFSRLQKNITLVPGPKDSLYPSTDKIDSNILSSFENMGITNYKGINIGWPRRITQQSIPLSEMKNIKENICTEELIGKIDNPNRVAYRVSHIILNCNSIYKVVGSGRRDYHNQPAIFLNVANGNGNEIKVRCGTKLFQLLNPIIDTITKIFYIKTGSKIRSGNHIVDIEVDFAYNF